MKKQETTNIVMRPCPNCGASLEPGETCYNCGYAPPLNKK